MAEPTARVPPGTAGAPHAKLELWQPCSCADWRVARSLVEAYAASLGLDLEFQNFAHELEHLAGLYAPPTGAFLVAAEQGAALGCVGLRRFAEGDGEIKRLYVDPAARGRGVGMQLARAIVSRGAALGYRRLLLDTLPAMREAQALYLSLGFRPMAAYRFNPLPGAAYYQLPLRAAGP